MKLIIAMSLLVFATTTTAYGKPVSRKVASIERSDAQLKLIAVNLMKAFNPDAKGKGTFWKADKLSRDGRKVIVSGRTVLESEVGQANCPFEIVFEDEDPLKPGPIAETAKISISPCVD